MTDIRTRLTAAVPGWTIDYEADAAYLQLTDDPIERTVHFGIINVDLDANGWAVGIELLTLNPQGEREHVVLVTDNGVAL